jgi:hypothetical protein
VNDVIEVSATEVLVEAAILLVAMVVAVAVYHGMQRPRLRLVPDNDVVTARWRVTTRDVIQYAVAIPILILAWSLALITVLAASPTNLSAPRIVIVASAIVLAARVLAHTRAELAHELAKTIPLTLVALILIGGQVRDLDGLRTLVEDFGRTSESAAAALLLVAADYAITATWYWVGVRQLAPRGTRVPGVPTGNTPRG